jgi:hypothetical protein
MLYLGDKICFALLLRIYELIPYWRYRLPLSVSSAA